MVDKIPEENETQRLETIGVIKLLLGTLRSWQQAPIPIVLAGSISLPFLLQDLEISELVINELERIELPPLDVEANEPRRMLEKLVEREGLSSWNEETYDQVLSRIDDPFPFFIDRAFEKLKTEDRSDGIYIDKIFRNEIWPDSRHAFYKQFDERLNDRFPSVKQRSLVRSLLKTIGTSEQGLGFDKIEAFITTEGVDNSIDAAKLVEQLVGLDFLVLHFPPMNDAKSEESPYYKLALNTIRSWLSARSA